MLIGLSGTGPWWEVFFFLRPGTSNEKSFFLSKLWLNSFNIVAISLPSNRYCTTHIRTEVNNSSWDQNIAKQKSHFGFELKMMPTENIRNLDQLVLGTLLFTSCLQAGLHSGRSGRTKELLAEPGAFKRNGHFLWCSIFGKAQKLSVCHKLVKCYGNLQDKYSSVF